jgi:hypothetical protein
MLQLCKLQHLTTYPDLEFLEALASIQTDTAEFLTFFQENFKKNSENGELA